MLKNPLFLLQGSSGREVYYSSAIDPRPTSPRIQPNGRRQPHLKLPNNDYSLSQTDGTVARGESLSGSLQDICRIGSAVDRDDLDLHGSRTTLSWRSLDGLLRRPITATMLNTPAIETRQTQPNPDCSRIDSGLNCQIHVQPCQFDCSLRGT